MEIKPQSYQPRELVLQKDFKTQINSWSTYSKKKGDVILVNAIVKNKATGADEAQVLLSSTPNQGGMPFVYIPLTYFNEVHNTPIVDQIKSGFDTKGGLGSGMLILPATVLGLIIIYKVIKRIKK
jgi:hypothetical protein